MKARFKHFLKHPRTIGFLSRLIAGYIGFVYRTTRWVKWGWEYPEAYWQEGKPFITCFWHNRLLMGCFAWEGPGTFHMLISAHGDGQLIAQTVAHYGIETIKGSTSKGGTSALRTIIKMLKTGATVGVTPDGPRGPRFRVSPGILAMAKLGGVDILPVTWSTTHRCVLGSWDRFILALPFGRGVVAWGKPIQLQDISSGNPERDMEIIEKALNNLCSDADTYCGHSRLDGG